MTKTATNLDLAKRIKLLDDRCEQVALDRSEIYRKHNYNKALLNVERPISSDLGRLAAIAADLDLIGEEITAMSNGAYAASVDPETGVFKLRETFGITGKLVGFTALHETTLVYEFDLAPIRIKNMFVSGTVTPKGYSMVAMGGLTLPKTKYSSANKLATQLH